MGNYGFPVEGNREEMDWMNTINKLLKSRSQINIIKSHVNVRVHCIYYKKCMQVARE